MKISSPLFISAISFGVTAIAQSSPQCVNPCAPMYKGTEDCDITSISNSTTEQFSCLCHVKNFKSNAEACYACQKDYPDASVGLSGVSDSIQYLDIYGLSNCSDTTTSTSAASTASSSPGASATSTKSTSSAQMGMSGGVGHVLAGLSVTIVLGLCGVVF